MTPKRPYLLQLTHGLGLGDMHLFYGDQRKKRMGNLQSHMPVGPTIHLLRRITREKQPLEALAALFQLPLKSQLIVAGI